MTANLIRGIGASIAIWAVIALIAYAAFRVAEDLL